MFTITFRNQKYKHSTPVMPDIPELELPDLDLWERTDRRDYLFNELCDRYKDHPYKDILLRRIHEQFDHFYLPFIKVYGNNRDIILWIFSAFDIVAESLKKRSKKLHTSDTRREVDPYWFKSNQLIGMMLYVDLFSGNLQELKNKIPYLKELGVNYLHLMPLLKAREGRNDGGYAVADYRKVDARLGTMQDLRTLAQELHEQDINLVVDLVMNHTAREHTWAQKASNGDLRYQNFYHMFPDRSEPDEYEKMLPEVFPDFAPGNFTYYPNIERWVWTTFYEFQWDLNYANPDVFTAMLSEILFLANIGIDCLRLDAVPYIWKRKGTGCQNEPEAHYLVQAYRALVRIAAPSTIFKAEAIVAPEEIVKYLGVGSDDGKECDIAYNATLMCHLWHALACENTQLLRTTLEHLPRAPESSSWINYIRCHDDIGWGLSDEKVAMVHQDGHQTRLFCTNFYTGKTPNSYAEGYPFQRDFWSGEARVSGTAAALAGLQKALVEGEELAIEDAVKRILLLKNVMFTWKGIPLLYAGDEIGQMNDFSYLGDPYRKSDNRWVHRGPFSWQKAELRKYRGTVEYKLFEGIKKLIAARRNNLALHGHSTDRLILIDEEAAFAFERNFDGNSLLLLSNFGRRSLHVAMHKLPEEWRGRYYRNAFDGKILDFSFGDIVVEPYGFFWLEKTEEQPRKKSENTIIDVIAETQWGEEIYILGNIPQLGAWNPEKAVGPMKAIAYPNWELEIDLPANTYFEFQWVKMKDGKILEWSPDKYWMCSGDEIFYH